MSLLFQSNSVATNWPLQKYQRNGSTGICLPSVLQILATGNNAGFLPTLQLQYPLALQRNKIRSKLLQWTPWTIIRRPHLQWLPRSNIKPRPNNNRWIADTENLLFWHPVADAQFYQKQTHKKSFLLQRKTNHNFRLLHLSEVVTKSSRNKKEIKKTIFIIFSCWSKSIINCTCRRSNEILRTKTQEIKIPNKKKKNNEEKKSWWTKIKRNQWLTQQNRINTQ